MRESFVRFYRANRGTYSGDRRRFLREARELPYYRFFAGIGSASAALRRRHPLETIDELYARRVAAFVELIDSIERNGFDCRARIQLKYHLRGPAAGSLSLGDGCHRLSVMRSTKGPLLDGRCFFVTPSLASTARDNTGVLFANTASVPWSPSAGGA